MLIQKITTYAKLMRMDRPIGALLLLWPTLWALIIAAKGIPDWYVLMVFVCGVVLMRGAGCVINDFADRKIDGHVTRTKQRPLPAGDVRSFEAIILFVVLGAVSFALVLTMNRLTILLSFIGLALAFIYPFMKRYTNLPQLFLALAFSWSIPMAWTAQASQLTQMTWLVFLINGLWIIAYDTQYAMVDRDDDLKIGVKSTAILFGKYDKLIIGLLQFSTIALLALLGYICQLNAIFYIALLITAMLFVYQQILIKHRKRSSCFQAFLNNNYAGMAITFGLLFSFAI